MCADFMPDFGNWEEGGGVIVLAARTGEPSLGRSLASVGPPGLDKGVASPRRIADSSMGVRGELISDILMCAAWARGVLLERLLETLSCKGWVRVHEPTLNGFNAAWFPGG